MLARRLRSMMWLTGALFLHGSLSAQYYYSDGNYASNWILEVGAAAGIMNCLTDLGGHKGIGKGGIGDLNWKMSRPCSGLYLMAVFKEALGVRLEWSLGSVAARDAVLKKADPDLNGRYGRNLSFQTRISDLQLALEIHPLFFRHYEQDKAPYCSPYFVAGVGYYRFNPKASFRGRWYDLHPLRLEGQGFPEYAGSRKYRLQQLNIPLGIGLRYEAGSWMNMRLEVAQRILFTDYLDDVSTNYIDPLLFVKYLPPEKAAIAKQLYSRKSEIPSGSGPDASMQRGNPENNDTFFSVVLKLGFLIRPGRK